MNLKVKYKLTLIMADDNKNGSAPASTPTSTGGVKYDQDKVRLDLLPPIALQEIGRVLTFGAQKYGANNWRKGINYTRLIAALMRHMNAYNAGEDIDSESGMSHLAHAGCCIMFLIGLQDRKDLDDRYKA